jgi:arginase family enzyme
VSVRRVGNEAPGRDDAKYLPAIESVCTRLTETVSDALAAGETPLVLGGDHSVAIGSVVGSARGGATYREAHAALERVAHAASVRSLDLVEMNPILDDHNRTAELAVELAARALGERIL